MGEAGCVRCLEPDPTAGERDTLLRGQPGTLFPVGRLWPGLFSPRHSYGQGHSELRHFLFKKRKCYQQAQRQQPGHSSEIRGLPAADLSGREELVEFPF